MTRNQTQKERPAFKPRRYRRNARPAERGLGPEGGGWNIHQASAWSGIGEGALREMAKRHLAGEATLFPCYAVGRRIIIAREGFKVWFNGRPDPAPRDSARAYRKAV